MTELLKKAIKEISSKYLDRGEREFNSELYHQIRILIDKEKVLEVSCETNKKTVRADDPIFNDSLIRRCFFNNVIPCNSIRYRIPDLLIHEYNTTEKQELVIETKTRIIRNDILRDLAKLVVFCEGRLNYKKGILLLVNQSNDNRIFRNPDLKNIITIHKMIEIWVFRSVMDIEIINHENINN